MAHPLEIAILFGGTSEERDISAASAQNVLQSIDKKLFQPYLVELTAENFWSIHDADGQEVARHPLHDLRGNLEGNVRSYDFQVALVVIHGMPAENGALQSLLEAQGVAYTCCSMKASCVTFDKQITKTIAESFGIQCAKGYAVHTDDIESFDFSLNYPVIVKPNESGSSYGVQKIEDESELKQAMSTAGRFADVVLVEEFIVGREVAVGLVKVENTLHTFPITEIIPEGDFFDYEAKYEGKSQEITPASLEASIAEKLYEKSTTLYNKFGLNGVVRIDFFVCEEDVFLIEINTIPGMSEASIIPQQCLEYGWSLEQLTTQIIMEALSNAQERSDK